MKKSQKPCNTESHLTYRSSGVDLDAAGEAIKLIKEPVFSTFNKNVLNDLTSYAGLFLFESQKYRQPVLVSSTDGVGTKLILAKKTGIYNHIGQDLVAMCINDIICCGAKPLFFLDYIAWGKLDPQKARMIVGSIADSCRTCQAALIGGEMAEMPDMYAKDDIDLAGFAVGVVEKSGIIKPELVSRGDLLLGVPSSGIHSNGFSLIRKIIDSKNINLDFPFNNGISNEPGLKKTLGEALLAPTRLYFPVTSLLHEEGIKVNGIAHITGGGFYENINRIIPKNMDALITEGSWPVQEVFMFLQQRGNLEKDEMYRVFNMGIGLVLIINPDLVKPALRKLNNAGENAYIMGKVISGSGKVRINYDK